MRHFCVLRSFIVINLLRKIDFVSPVSSGRYLTTIQTKLLVSLPSVLQILKQMPNPFDIPKHHNPFFRIETITGEKGNIIGEKIVLFLNSAQPEEN